MNAKVGRAGVPGDLNLRAAMGGAASRAFSRPLHPCPTCGRLLLGGRKIPRHNKPHSKDKCPTMNGLGNLAFTANGAKRPFNPSKPKLSTWRDANERSANRRMEEAERWMAEVRARKAGK